VSRRGLFQRAARYQERVLSVFASDEISTLALGLGLLAESRQQVQIAVSPDMLRLLAKAKEKLGDLSICSIHGKWRIDSYNLPKLGQ
jgi:hypothetical protein